MISENTKKKTNVNYTNNNLLVNKITRKRRIKRAKFHLKSVFMIDVCLCVFVNLSKLFDILFLKTEKHLQSQKKEEAKLVPYLIGFIFTNSDSMNVCWQFARVVFVCLNRV